ncbi:MAG TPA: HAD-IIB family hydrolase [Caldithrix sp.]|nr:HAD-IIB family hydrolase [Caldithrix sp.]
MNPDQIKKFLTNRVQVIYSDVDGTFVKNGCLFCTGKGYSLKNARAIYHLLSAGVDLVMTSGREKEKLKETARILGLKNYIANLGMEIVYNQGERVINNFGTEVADRAALKKWIHDTGAVDSLLEKFSGKLRPYAPWAEILRTHYLFIGEVDYRELYSWVDSHFPGLRIIDNGAVPAEKDFRSPHAYHLLPINVGKKSAVQIDKKERSLKRENLIGIGDSPEDVSIADEVAVFFLLNKNVQTDRRNVIYLSNEDGTAFGRIIDYLQKGGFF